MTTAVLNDHLTRSFAALQSTFLLFEKYHYSIFDNLSQALKLLVTKIDKADRFYQQALFDARWFPHVIRTESTELFEDVAEVLCTTRSDSKNRTKRLDSVFFSFYNQRALNDLKRKWRSIEDLPSYIKKIATQAVNAYQRKEYALTLSAFCTLWEGIIAKKSGKEDDYKISRKTRDALVELNDENEIGEIVTRFCTECIFPDCHSIQDVKEDLPLRHAIVHSWYTKYPTRKTALNAILFTDFLFELDSKVTLLEESHG